MNIQISCDAFRDGEAIPVPYTCDGKNISPALSWNSIPMGAQSLALVCEDPDAPSGTFVHWVLYDLPPVISDLPEALPATERLSNGASQGRNDFQHIGYDGPCPPRGAPSHRYFFRLYALDIEPNLAPGATREELAQAINGHILAAGVLMGRYQRTPSQK